MTRVGWSSGKGLGKSENGGKFPVANGVSSGKQDIVEQIGRLVGEKNESVELCGELGRPCVSCDKRKGDVYTILGNFDDDKDDEEANSSLPKLPEVTVDLYGREIQALIDTGSQITAITSKLYESIKSR